MLPGLVLSTYFAGFTLRALRCGQIIERIGHIRACEIGSLAPVVLRVIVGFGCAGIFVTTESRLSDGPTHPNAAYSRST
jgi:hypothetical protein